MPTPQGPHLTRPRSSQAPGSARRGLHLVLSVLALAAASNVYACENPQVLQRLAAAGVERRVACFSGNPAAAGMVLLGRTVVRYHGDFGWAGIAIARRIFERGRVPGGSAATTTSRRLQRLPVDSRLGLSGRVEATPWDEKLGAAMTATDVAVHEEAIVNLLLADLGSG